MHLYTMLQHDIGLNSRIFGGLGTFGTRVISVEFTSLNSLLDVKNEPTTFKTSSFTISQVIFEEMISISIRARSIVPFHRKQPSLSHQYHLTLKHKYLNLSNT
jgi:hypothetical protein